MKKFFVILTIFIFSCLLGLLSGFWKFNKQDYLSDKVLDIAVPINGTIDTELFKSLLPAYEQH